MARLTRSLGILLAALAASPLPPALAKDNREAVIVSGFDGELTNQHPPDEMRWLPPSAVPIYFYPQNSFEKGRTTLPPEGLVHAVAVYLSKNGYWVTHKDAPPTVILALHWFTQRDDITHFGKPSQLVDLAGPGGQGVLVEDGEAQNPPFCPHLGLRPEGGDGQAAEDRETLADGPLAARGAAEGGGWRSACPR